MTPQDIFAIIVCVKEILFDDEHEICTVGAKIIFIFFLENQQAIVLHGFLCQIFKTVIIKYFAYLTQFDLFKTTNAKKVGDIQFHGILLRSQNLTSNMSGYSDLSALKSQLSRLSAIELHDLCALLVLGMLNNISHR